MESTVLARVNPLSVLLCAASMLWGPSAHASPQDLFGYGARSQGMAMTGASTAVGYEAAYHNPAGLAGTERRQITLGFAANDFHLQVDGENSPLETSRGIVIGIALPLPFGGPLRDLLTLGAGFFTPTNAVMSTESPYAERVQWPVLSRSQVVALQVGMGVNLGRWARGLSLGFGISGSANTIGRIRVELDAANQFVSRTETQLTSRLAPIAGARFVRERYGFGVTYHAKIESRIRMNIEVTDLPVQLPLLTIYSLAQYDPHSLVAEGYYAPNDHLRIVGSMQWRRWSPYPGPLSKSSDGSYRPPYPDFRDTVSPRVAAEWNHDLERTTVSFRGGYAFEPSPAPRASQRLALNNIGEPRGDGSLTPVRYLDSNRHLLSAGFGMEYRPADEDAMHFRLDLATTLQVVTARTHAISQEGRTDPIDSRGLIPGAAITLGAEW